MNFGIKGEGRVILREQDGTEVSDTGWVTNTITDNSLVLLITTGTIRGGRANLFIHQNTNPGRVFCNLLHNTYLNQTPSQVRAPDTVVSDTNTNISTFTVQYPVPAVARNINIVGLTNNITIDINAKAVIGILAYTRLTTTVTQSTSQTADVQYRITWSFP